MTYDVHIQIFFANASQPTMITFFSIEVQSLERNYDSQLHVFTRGKLLWPKKKGEQIHIDVPQKLIFFVILKKMQTIHYSR